MPSILTVNTTADSTAPSSALTLREAILLVDNGGNAQAALGRNLTGGEAGQISGTFGVNDTIQFDITAASDAAGGGTGYDPTTGVSTIQAGSALPAITAAVVINGASQPGYMGTPLIVLSGLGAGDNVSGLVVTGGNSTVTGLVINQFSGDGIDLTTNGGDVIAGNYIGTDVTGTSAAGNGGFGIVVCQNAGGNTIGGSDSSDRNVISGIPLRDVEHLFSGHSAAGEVHLRTILVARALGMLSPFGNPLRPRLWYRIAGVTFVPVVRHSSDSSVINIKLYAAPRGRFRSGN